MLTGDALDAHEAYALGMVTKVFPPDELADRTLEFARRIAQLPTMSALLIKEAVNQSVDNMGFYNALNACFTLHELNHSHWAQLNEDKFPIAKEEHGDPQLAQRSADRAGREGQGASGQVRGEARRRPPPPGPPPDVVRRAPFADNPQVGARGQRTQQRILDAALEVFGESGYHGCGVDAIATRAGCSRRGLLPVLLQQGGRVPGSRGTGGAPARRRARGARAAVAGRGGVARSARLGRAPRRDLRALRAGVRRLPRGLRERRRDRERVGSLGAAGGLAHPLADRPVPACARARSASCSRSSSA